MTKKTKKLNKLLRTSTGSLSEYLESGYSVIGSAMRCWWYEYIENAWDSLRVAGIPISHCQRMGTLSKGSGHGVRKALMPFQ